MNRSLNISSAGRRILGTPKVGILAAQILAETADGDNGAGALHNEAEQAEYAGMYLRLRVLNFPAVGKLFVYENGTVDWKDLPIGVHAFEYALDVDAVPQPGSAWFTITIGAVDAAAPGATLTGTATLTPGTATGQQSATAPGATLTGTATLTPGTATGEQNATAPGATLTGTATLEPGSAVGTNPGTAPGVTLTGTATLTPGAAVVTNPNATAPGVTLTGTATLVPGMAHDGAALDPGPASHWVRPPRRVWYVKPARRSWIIRPDKRTPIGEKMPLPTKDPAEIKTVTFDFSDDATEIATATSTARTVAGINDTTPSAVIGTQSIAGPLVMLRVQAGVDGSSYGLRCVATDADGEVHIATTLLPVKSADYV